MSTPNYYPQFPEIPYQRTSIDMKLVILLGQELCKKYGASVVRTAYCMFRNETANGRKGVNNNYGGIQADNAKWEGLDLSNVVGTCVKKDSGGVVRRFICFNEHGYITCFDFMCYKVKQRGMYLGAPGITTPTDVAVAYLKKWVGINYDADPKSKVPEVMNFRSMYAQAQKYFI